MLPQSPRPKARTDAGEAKKDNFKAKKYNFIDVHRGLTRLRSERDEESNPRAPKPKNLARALLNSKLFYALGRIHHRQH